ncbi:hypothetical protein MAR_032863 [Mya arenaria]|uniref:Apple domain-containing protein n=1 Tax=Mya arenaria TaxID=6604 RepID=A0ABY7GB54_MYAAR|nr:hypothetical protein MAR_032863 [Mya arenaria]
MKQYGLQRYNCTLWNLKKLLWTPRHTTEHYGIERNFEENFKYNLTLGTTEYLWNLKKLYRNFQDSNKELGSMDDREQYLFEEEGGVHCLMLLLTFLFENKPQTWKHRQVWKLQYAHSYLDVIGHMLEQTSAATITLCVEKCSKDDNADPLLLHCNAVRYNANDKSCELVLAEDEGVAPGPEPQENWQIYRLTTDVPGGCFSFRVSWFFDSTTRNPWGYGK